ncbi:MAG TPA: TspO/MBR family protein [Herpetosiphonaceae bacterium]
MTSTNAQLDGDTSQTGSGHALARLAQQVFVPQHYRWWHGLAFGLAANAISGLSLGRRRQDQRYYESLRQAPFAPPSWAFGPAWTINNISVLWGNLRLLNIGEDTSHRRTLLWLQATSWAIYSTFSYVYFKQRSPILAFTWTGGMYVLTICSMLLASKIDRKIVLSLVTLLLWLSLATPVAAYQMIYNDDPLFGTPAWR